MKGFALILFLLSSLVTLVTTANATTTTLTAIAYIARINGTIKAISADKKERVLQEKSAVFPKDIIVTDKNSYAGLRFTDGTLLVMQPQTAMQINQYKFNKNANDKFELILGSGGIHLSPGAIAAANSKKFTVQTVYGDINPMGRADSIAAAANFGLAFSGMGIIHTDRGTKAIDQPTYVTVDPSTLLPVVVSIMPKPLTGAEPALAEDYLQSGITAFGANRTYQETATYNVTVTKELLSEETAVQHLKVNQGYVSGRGSASMQDPEDDDLAPMAADDNYDGNDNYDY